MGYSDVPSSMHERSGATPNVLGERRTMSGVCEAINSGYEYLLVVIRSRHAILPWCMTA